MPNYKGFKLQYLLEIHPFLSEFSEILHFEELKPIFSSSDPKVSSAELMVLLICPSSVVVRRPSVNFCFKSLLLLQFLFDNSEFFTGETRHIVPPCNKAGISNFCLEFQKLQKFQISWKRYSSYSSYSKILNFLLEKTRHIVPPCNKAGISNFCLEFQKLQTFQWKRHFSSVLIRSFWNFTGETRYIVWPYSKARISNWFGGQLDCSILANLLKQKVLKYVIMHSLWQLS